MAPIARPFRVFDLPPSHFTRNRRFLRDVVLRGIAFHTLVSVEVQGMAEALPANGPALVMMNHIGGIDPIVLMGVIGPRFLNVMTKVENYHVLPLVPFIRLWGAYPILRGEVDRRALEFTLKLLKEDSALVLIAPEGTRRPELSEAKDGLAYLAVKAGAPIVPVGLEGTREFFTNLKRLRRTRISVRFGRPFRFRTDGRARVSRPEMARMTAEAMYQLALLLPEKRRGFYADLSRATTGTLDFLPQAPA